MSKNDLPLYSGAYCEKKPEPSGSLPVIDSTTERMVFFWNLIESSVIGIHEGSSRTEVRSLIEERLTWSVRAIL